MHDRDSQRKHRKEAKEHLESLDEKTDKLLDTIRDLSAKNQMLELENKTLRYRMFSRDTALGSLSFSPEPPAVNPSGFTPWNWIDAERRQISSTSGHYLHVGNELDRSISRNEAYSVPYSTDILAVADAGEVLELTLKAEDLCQWTQSQVSH